MASPNKKLSANNPDRLVFLDGIRGWGALIVLMFHLFVEGLPVTAASGHGLSKLFFFNGTLAVWLFFIASGFSLSIGFIKTRDKRTLWKLACGRYIRLALPVLFFSFLMFCALKAGMVPFTDNRPDGLRSIVTYTPGLFAALRLSLWNAFFDFYASTALIPALWTMPIELKGSLGVLFLCAVFGSYKYRLWFYALLIVDLAFIADGLYYYAAFVCGILAAEIYHSDWRPAQKWVPAMIFMSGIGLSYLLPDSHPRLYLFVSCLLFFGTMYFIPARRFLESRASIFLGRISFPLYLLHEVIIFTVALPLTLKVASLGEENKNLLVIFLVGVNCLTVLLSLILSRSLVSVDEFSINVSRKFSAFLLRRDPIKIMH